MGSKHIKKYFQKYHIFFSSATSLAVLVGCSTTRKVPDGQFLLTKNSYTYEDHKAHADELPDYVLQKPNKKQLFFLPLSLWFYNSANPKYDTIITEYLTYPSEMRDQELRDSLFIKNGKPELVGKSLFKDRILHNFGTPPVILEHGKTESSADNIRKRLVFRGYWDAKVQFNEKLDSASKKAQVEYKINHLQPTFIKDYYYNISDPEVKRIYEKNIAKSIVRSGQILDQTKLEDEVKRLNDLMRQEGYYKFNNANQDIYFTADTLKDRKNVPLTIDIQKDSIGSPYKKTTIGKINLIVREEAEDQLTRDSLRGITFQRADERYKIPALWRPIILKTGDLYDQRNLDQTKKNLATMNNFTIIPTIEERKGSDSILDVQYELRPLPKYEFRVSTDLTYSQILNFGVSPAVELLTRNVFGGAENLTTSFSGTFGSVKNTKNPDKRAIAYEIAAQANLALPKLLLPFRYYKIIPKKYSPTSSITLGTSVQENIGLGRINFNAGLNYYATVNDIVTHRLSLFNTQLSFTRSKDKYYDFFPRDRDIRDDIFQIYDPALYSQFENGLISSDDFTQKIMQDPNFAGSLDPNQMDTYNSFVQSLFNKDRQTQDVIISSILYNFIYNEIGKKDYPNPFYLNAKVETSGNMLGIFGKTREQAGQTFDSEVKTIFGTPYSQFVKFDFDVRKYFQFFGNHTLVLRQFVGVGIPYGNSSTMPFVRSYFNGGSNDIRAWRVFGGLGPSDSQLDERVRSYVMENMKLTTNIEYRMPFNEMFEGAAFIDAGNIWSLKKNQFGDHFTFKDFISEMGVGTGVGLRINIAYVTLRLDAAYKMYDPNKPVGDRWVINKWQPLKPVINFAFGYPF